MAPTTTLPLVIQGGMGVAVSNWRLARAVASAGQLGVVSGTGLDTVLVRRLHDGDPGGHVRRAMQRFPIPGVAERVLARYFRPGGAEVAGDAGGPADAADAGGAGGPGEPYPVLPLYRQAVDRSRDRLTALANFVEVHLAREGHDGPVGLNLLAKIQLPNLASLYGAMLAGVDYVLMGAGIPREIPGILDRLRDHAPVELTLEVEGLPRGESETMTLDPGRLHDGSLPELKRPAFLAVVASDSLARMLARKSDGRVDGFVVEGPTAGGHLAPPRGAKKLNARGEPIYGERDAADLERVAELGLPFWVAGGAGHPDRLRLLQPGGRARHHPRGQSHRARHLEHRAFRQHPRDHHDRRRDAETDSRDGQRDALPRQRDQRRPTVHRGDQQFRRGAGPAPLPRQSRGFRQGGPRARRVDRTHPDPRPLTPVS